VRTQYREELAVTSIYKTATYLIGSFVLGAGMTQILHAQGKPPAYGFAEIAVKDEDGYKKDFLPEAQRMIKEAGGKYIAGGFNKATTLSGAAPPNRVILIQYDSMDALMKAWEGGLRDWQEKNGGKYATFRGLAIEGVEQK
jgi:uncharacterized protein (DUF1330 family)